jgi:hypothetical protein
MIGNLFKQIKRERKKANSWESANTCSEKEKGKKKQWGLMPAKLWMEEGKDKEKRQAGERMKQSTLPHAASIIWN